MSIQVHGADALLAISYSDCLLSVKNRGAARAQGCNRLGTLGRHRLCCELPNQGLFLIIKCITLVLKELIPCWQGKERRVSNRGQRQRGRDSVCPIINTAPPFKTFCLHSEPSHLPGMPFSSIPSCCSCRDALAVLQFYEKNRRVLRLLVGHKTHVCSRSRWLPRYFLCTPQTLLSVVPQTRGPTAGSYRTHFPYKAAQVVPSSRGFHGLGKGGAAWPWQGADQKAEFSMKLWEKKPNSVLPLPKYSQKIASFKSKF